MNIFLKDAECCSLHCRLHLTKISWTPKHKIYSSKYECLVVMRMLDHITYGNQGGKKEGRTEDSQEMDSSA